MSTLYEQVVRSPVGRLVASRTPLPQPVVLERRSPGAPVLNGTLLLGAAPGGRLRGEVEASLRAAGVEALAVLEPEALFDPLSPATTARGDGAQATAIARQLSADRGVEIGSHGVQLLGGHGYAPPATARPSCSRSGPATPRSSTSSRGPSRSSCSSWRGSCWACRRLSCGEAPVSLSAP